MPNNKKIKNKKIKNKYNDLNVNKIKNIDFEASTETGMRLKFPSISDDLLPPISIITPTRNRRSVFELTIYQFLNFRYPRDKIQWVILDNGTDKIKDLLPLDGNNIKYMTLDGNKRYNVGDLRNHCIKHCDYDIIVYMDDDDYYPKESLYARVMTLIKYRTEGVECCGSINAMMYSIISGDICTGSNGNDYLLEATMCHTKRFWETRSFKKTNTMGEFKYFIKNRQHKIRAIPFQFVCIPLNHIINTTNRGYSSIKGVNKTDQIIGKINKDDINYNNDINNNVFLNKIVSPEIKKIITNIKYSQIIQKCDELIKIREYFKSNITIAYLVDIVDDVNGDVNNNDYELLPLYKYIICSHIITMSEYNYTFYIAVSANSIYNNKDIQHFFEQKFNKIKNNTIVFVQAEKDILNRIFKKAYDDGCSYFYKTTDIMEFITLEWTKECIKQTKKNNISGISNGLEELNDYIFISRKHMERFGELYPSEEDFNKWIKKQYNTTVSNNNRYLLH